MPVKKKTTAKKKRAAKTGSRSAIGALPALVIMGLITAVLFLVTKRDQIPAPGSGGKDGKKTDLNAKKSADIKETEEQSRDKKAVKPDEIEVPPKEVKVYFLAVDDATEKIRLVPVKRKVAGKETLESALKELIKGPGTAEKSKGYISAIPGGLKLRSAKIRDGAAVLDFNGALEEGATGSILLSRIDQIVYTATQFDGVGGVVLKINGSRRSTLGSDGLSVSGTLHRRPQ